VARQNILLARICVVFLALPPWVALRKAALIPAQNLCFVELNIKAAGIYTCGFLMHVFLFGLRLR
jgi:hypothetical protein